MGWITCYHCYSCNHFTCWQTSVFSVELLLPALIGRQREKLGGKMQCKDGTPLFAALCISLYWLHWSSRAGYFLVAQNALFLGTIKECLTWVLFTVASQLHSISLSGKYFCNSERQQDLEKGLGFSDVSERLCLWCLPSSRCQKM